MRNRTLEVELERVRYQGLLNLLLAVEGLGAVAGRVQSLTRKQGGLTRGLAGEKHLVKQAENGGCEVVLVGLLLPFQVFALRVALGDASVGLLRGEELAGSLLDAAHGGLVAGEDAEVVLLTEAVEEPLDLLRRDLGIRADDEQHPALAHTVGGVFQPRQRQDVFIGGLAHGLEHVAQAMADEVVHLVLGRVVGEALQELGEGSPVGRSSSGPRACDGDTRRTSPVPRTPPGIRTARAAARRGTRPFPRG
jgi:hypothetical protein